MSHGGRSASNCRLEGCFAETPGSAGLVAGCQGSPMHPIRSCTSAPALSTTSRSPERLRRSRSATRSRNMGSMDFGIWPHPTSSWANTRASRISWGVTPKNRPRLIRERFVGTLTGREGQRLLEAKVRLFAHSGTAEYGMPIYRVVMGAPRET
jgi:hypothetical protein